MWCPVLVELSRVRVLRPLTLASPFGLGLLPCVETARAVLGGHNSNVDNAHETVSLASAVHHLQTP